METLEELLAQQVAIAKRVDEMRQRRRADAIANVQAAIAENGLTPSEVFGTTRAAKGPKTPKVSGKVAPKYRDPETGKTWTGRGKAPLWIAGKDKSIFLIP